MATIKNCIKHSGLSASDIEVINSLSQEYIDEGLSTREAMLKVVNEELLSLENSFQAVLKQVKSSNIVKDKEDASKRQIGIQGFQPQQEQGRETQEVGGTIQEQVSGIEAPTPGGVLQESVSNWKATTDYDNRSTGTLAFLNKFVKKLNNQIDNIDVRLVWGPEELAEYPSITADLFDQDGAPTDTFAGMRGMYYKVDTAEGKKNVVVINPNNIKDKKTGAKTIFHEVAGHFGVQDILKEDYNNFITRTIQTNPKALAGAMKLFPKWQNLYTKENGTVNIINDKEVFSKTPQKGYIKVGDKYVEQGMVVRMMEEYLAVQAEKFVTKDTSQTQKEASFIKKFINYIRHKLRTILSPDIANEITDEDIANLLSTSKEKYIEGTPELADIKTGEEEETTTSTTGLASAVDKEVSISNKVQDIIKDPLISNSVLRKYQKVAKDIGDKVSSLTGYSGLANLKDANRVRDMERRTVGLISKIDKKAKVLTKEVFDPLQKKGKEQYTNQILRMWEDGTIHNLELDEKGILSKDSYLTLPEDFRKNVSYLQMKLVKDWNEQLVSAQNFYIDNKTLKLEDPKLGTYVAQMYKEHTHRYFGIGPTPSKMDWSKKRSRKPGEPNLIPIKDPKVRLIFSVMQLGHDAAKHTLMQNLVETSDANNLAWVVGNRERHHVVLNNIAPLHFTDNIPKDTDKINVNKTYAGLAQLQNRYEEILKDPGDLLTTEDKVRLDQNIKALEDTLKQLDESVFEQYGITRDEYINNYVYIDPRKYKTFGALRGLRIDKRLWNELYGGSEYAMHDGVMKFVNDMLSNKFGRNVEEANAVWKVFKTYANVPGYWTRAFLSTAYTVDHATDTPTYKIANYWYNELQNIKDQSNAKKYGGKTLLEWAGMFGASSTSFGEGELHTLLRTVEDVSLQDIKKAASDVKAGNQKFSTIPQLGWKLLHGNMGKFMQKASDINSNMDMLFKLTLMRDYVEKYESQAKNTNASIYKLDELQVEQIMSKAAEYSADGVAEYNIDLPAWLKTLRRSPIGAPFLTWTYKNAGITAKSIIRNPQKHIRDLVFGWLVLEGIQALSGMSDDDYEEGIKNMPLWAKNKSATIPLPFKDNSGRMSFMDLSYVWPPAMFVDLAGSVIEPAPGETRTGSAVTALTDEFGLFGGPIPQIIAASTTGIDPFTDRPIVEPGMTLTEKSERWANWIWSLATIPGLSDSGVVADIINQAKGEKTEFGTDKQSIFSDVVSNLGINVKDYVPREQKVRNEKVFQKLRNDIIKNRNMKLKNSTLSGVERVKIAAQAAEQIKQLNKQWQY